MVYAQNPESSNNEVVRQVDLLYRSGKLDDAELKALRLLSEAGKFSSIERADLYRILAFIAIAREDRERGALWFKDALAENPKMYLDQTFTSPKILSVFNRAKVEFEQQIKSLNKFDVQELHMHKLKIEAGKRSILLPGLGQFYKGHKFRGGFFLGTASLATLGIISSEILLKDRKDKYQDETDPKAASSRYDEYKQVYQLRNGMVITLCAIWSVNVLEAFLSKPDSRLSRNVQIGLVPVKSDMMNLGLGIKFNF